MKKVLTKVFIISLILVLGAIIYMKINNSDHYDENLEINLNNKNENYIYDKNSNLEYNRIGIYAFPSIFGTETSIEELNKTHPITYLKKKENIYYTIYSLKDNQICYIIFKEKGDRLYIDYSWIYSRDMIGAEEILNIKIGTNYQILKTIDNNTIYIEELSSASYTINFLKDGITIIMKANGDGLISEIIERNSIYNIVHDIDFPENILK